jgi:hypothetical protein
MRSSRRLALVSVALVAFRGCGGGPSDESQPIELSPAAAPAATGFVALYAPPYVAGGGSQLERRVLSRLRIRGRI